MKKYKRAAVADKTLHRLIGQKGTMCQNNLLKSDTTFGDFKQSQIR